MANLKEIRGRIDSVRGTLKITSAMRLIATAKMRSAQNAMGSAIPYGEALEDILSTLGEGLTLPSPKVEDEWGSALSSLCPREAVVLVTSNQTLCGSFNVNLLKAFGSLGLAADRVKVYAVGKYGFKTLSKAGLDVVDCSPLAGAPEYGAAVDLAGELVRGFDEGEFSRVRLVYAHFASALSQPVKILDFLGAAASEDISPAGADATLAQEDFLFEPSRDTIISALAPKVLRWNFFSTLMDAATAEHAARALAMQIASDNAEDLLGELSLTYNKLRQQAITNEILDLLGGQTNNS